MTGRRRNPCPHLVLAIIVLALAGGCAGRTAPATATATPVALPAWITHPESVTAGRAATACIPASGDTAQDVKVATIKARATLVQNESARIRSETRVESRKSAQDGRATLSTRYEESVVQEASGVVAGAEAIRIETVPINGIVHVCVMIAGG